ncbi:hypothetical protein [Burkholderia stagnalis]|uniref:hypothetical protein n=1 Tax=Burkholderia stagnalis TaxID=1503054 RepID=UPI000753F5D7|nr:hypothetical protein [Burkholderia stagnalis]KVO51916.1 hypothetical protein WT18_02355 [Burkholderia stagnalis]KVP11037.1 hypothetical protein WT20_15865 [Burkholderia stagnalis]KVW98746.1 hypothetical protein WT30_07745 [Burkholderia stagnalis]KWH79619.1 hypothetical protein WT66_12955 [Burkholderia stagnalis]KWK16766.1 hypothetical protein WT77_29200 [Burkholderia stagnalis]
MSSISDNALIEGNLNFILGEMKAQPEIAEHYPPDGLTYEEHLAQIHEFIADAGEYGLAYEYVVGALESMPFRLTGAAAVKLLEIGLLMGFKSEEELDRRFDRRPSL